jgi:hypothetical protein
MLFGINVGLLRMEANTMLVDMEIVGNHIFHGV